MPVPYKDLSFRIIASMLAAHFIVMYGVKISFFHVLLKPMYWIAMLGSALIAFLLMLLVRFISIRLDRQYDWERHTIQRVLFQIVCGLILPGLIAFLLAAAYFAIRGTNILTTLYLRIDYPVIVLLILLVNVYYLVYYVIARLKAVKSEVLDIGLMETDGGDGKGVYLVSKGARNIPVPIEDIAYFFREGDYNFLRTFEGEDLPLSQSLDETEQLVSGKDFFRVNRQILISRNACRYFENLPHNKLELSTAPPYKRLIVISQKRSRAFKDWINA